MPKLAVALFTLVLVVCDASADSHRALLGHWKSNAEKTLASMRATKGLPAKARALFENGFFGNLKVQWRERETRAVDERDGFDSGFQPYQVVEVASGSVKVQINSDDLLIQQEITLYFDGDCYYTLISKFAFREYFCRDKE